MWFQKPPLGTPLDWSNPLNKGTVLALPMNEGHGDVVRDLSMYGNHGKMSNFAFPATVASGWNPGQTGIGLNFDETARIIFDQINIDTTYTLSGLYRPTSLATYPHIWCKFATTNYIRIQADGSAIYGETNTNDDSFMLSYPFVVNNWYNIVIVGSPPNIIKLYVNGIFADSDTVTNPTISITTISYSGVRYFVGSADQPRIMNRAWTAKEVMDYAINPWQVYLDD